MLTCTSTYNSGYGFGFVITSDCTRRAMDTRTKTLRLVLEPTLHGIPPAKSPTFT